MEFTWKNTAMMGIGTKRAPLLHACAADQRFSYYTYLPVLFNPDDGTDYKIVVAIHDTFRNAESLKNRFADFADANQCIVIAPLFPTGIVDSQDLHNYKFIVYQGIRFDHIVLSMVQEVTDTFGLSADRFFLYGFSGGGQFAHRFLYLHPERLLGIAIGAPGRITYLDDSISWPHGTKNMREVFGQDLHLDAVRMVPTLILVGADDTEVLDYTGEPGDSAEGNIHGNTRVEKVTALAQNYRDNGITVTFRAVEGQAHDDHNMLPEAASFFEAILTEA